MEPIPTGRGKRAVSIFSLTTTAGCAAIAGAVLSHAVASGLAGFSVAVSAAANTSFEPPTASDIVAKIPELSKSEASTVQSAADALSRHFFTSYPDVSAPPPPPALPRPQTPSSTRPNVYSLDISLLLLNNDDDDDDDDDSRDAYFSTVAGQKALFLAVMDLAVDNGVVKRGDANLPKALSAEVATFFLPLFSGMPRDYDKIATDTINHLFPPQESGKDDDDDSEKMKDMPLGWFPECTLPWVMFGPWSSKPLLSFSSDAAGVPPPSKRQKGTPITQILDPPQSTDKYNGSALSKRALKEEERQRGKEEKYEAAVARNAGRQGRRNNGAENVSSDEETFSPSSSVQRVSSGPALLERIDQFVLILKAAEGREATRDKERVRDETLVNLKEMYELTQDEDDKKAYIDALMAKKEELAAKKAKIAASGEKQFETPK